MGRASEHRWHTDRVLERTPRKVGGCMYNLTQTTGNQRSQGRACPPTTSLDKPGDVDTLVLQVSALILHQHRRRMSSKRNTSVPCIFGGAGQRACTVPTSTTNTVIRISSRELFYHTHRKTETQPPLPQLRNGAFIPSHEWRRDFPRRYVKFRDTRYDHCVYRMYFIITVVISL